MKRYLLVVLFIALVSHSKGQKRIGLDNEWVIHFDGVNSQHVNALIIDKYGDIYFAGGFGAPIEFVDALGNSHNYSYGSPGADTDGFYFKFSPNGKLDLSYTFGYISQTSNPASVNQEVGAAYYNGDERISWGGNICGMDAPFKSGSRINEIDCIDGSAWYIGETDLSLHGYFAQGSYDYGSTDHRNYTGAKDICADKLGNIYTIGKFNSNWSSGNNKEIYFRKTWDTINNPHRWAYWPSTLIRIGNGSGNSVAVDDSNNVYFSGNVLNDSMFFGPQWLNKYGLSYPSPSFRYNLKTDRKNDDFILKFDTTGYLVWYKAIKNENAGAIREIRNSKDGNLIVQGYFSGFSVDLDLGKGTDFYNGDTTAYPDFIQKMNTNGESIWTNIIGDENGNITLHDIDILNDGSILAIGTFVGNLSFKIDNITRTFYNIDDQPDILFLKMEPDGDYVWVESLEQFDSQKTTIWKLLINGDIDGNIYVGGNFTQILNTSIGNRSDSIVEDDSYGTDCFMMKLKESNYTGFSKNQLEGLRLYPNPNNGTFRISGLQYSNASLKVFNINGECVYFINSIDREELSLKLSPGYYIAEVKSVKNFHSFKVIVTN